MANRNEALQLGFFSAKDLAISNSVSPRQLRFSCEQALKKQEFAEMYFQWLRKHTQFTQNDKSAKNNQNHATFGPGHSAKEYSVYHPKQVETDAARSGRNLPKDLANTSERQNSMESDSFVTHEKKAQIGQGEISNRHKNNVVDENSFIKSNTDAFLQAEFPQTLFSQDSALFKDRLFALTQNNSSQIGNANLSDLNKLLLQQKTLLFTDTEDQLLNDFNIDGAEKAVVSDRLPGSLPLFSQMLQMSSALGHRGWSNEVGQRLIWMMNTDLLQAKLQLNPKHLGPLEINITMTADQQLDVNFLTHSASVKEVLDQTLPRLREIFGQSDLHLNEVNVQQVSSKQHCDYHHNAGNGLMGPARLAANMREDDPAAQIFHRQSLSSSIVDCYA